MLANTPQTPYYAVIFSSTKTDVLTDYNTMAQAMDKLVQEQDGFLGYESANGVVDITVSYWDSLEAIVAWKNQANHLFAQEQGKKKWYQSFKVRIALVQRDYEFNKEN